MNEKCLALFIYETSLLTDVDYWYTDREQEVIYNFSPSVVNNNTIKLLDYFITMTYEDNKELLANIFDINLLKEFISNNYQILEPEKLVQILSKYTGIDGYVRLIDNIDQEAQSKINELSRRFVIFYKEMEELIFSPSPKGLSKIYIS